MLFEEVWIPAFASETATSKLPSSLEESVIAEGSEIRLGVENVDVSQAQGNRHNSEAALRRIQECPYFKS
jgi:hypothetical protein